MPTADPPLVSVPERSPGAHRLFVLRAFLLGWIVLDSWMVRSLIAFDASSVPGGRFTFLAIWLAFAGIEIGLLVGLRREVGAHPAAGLLDTTIGLAVANLGVLLVSSVPTFGGPDVMERAIEASPGLHFTVYVGLEAAFDIVLWQALEGLLGGALRPGMRAAFYTLRLATAALYTTSILPLGLESAIPFSGELRFVTSVAWQVVVLVALSRLAQRGSGAPATVGGI